MSIELLTADFTELASQWKAEFNKDREDTEDYIIHLEKDPSRKSPAELFKKVHFTREYVNVLSVRMMKYFKASTTIENFLSYREEEFDKKINGILLEKRTDWAGVKGWDEKLRLASSLVDADFIERLHSLRLFAKNLKSYYNYFKQRVETLNKSREDLLTQLGALKAMIALRELEIPIGNFSSFDDKPSPSDPEESVEERISEGTINL